MKLAIVLLAASILLLPSVAALRTSSSEALYPVPVVDDPFITIRTTSFSQNATGLAWRFTAEPTARTPSDFKGDINITDLVCGSGVHTFEVDSDGLKSKAKTKNGECDVVLSFRGSKSLSQRPNITVTANFSDYKSVQLRAKAGNGSSIVVVQPTGFISVSNDYGNFTYSTAEFLFRTYDQANGSVSGSYGNGSSFYNDDPRTQSMGPTRREAGSGSWCFGHTSGTVADVHKTWDSPFFLELSSESTTCGPDSIRTIASYDVYGFHRLNDTDTDGQGMFMEVFQDGGRNMPNFAYYKGNLTNTVDFATNEGVDITTNFGIVGRKGCGATENCSLLFHIWNNTAAVGRAAGVTPRSNSAGSSSWAAASRASQIIDYFGFAGPSTGTGDALKYYNLTITNTVSTSFVTGSGFAEGTQELNLAPNATGWVQVWSNNSAANPGILDAKMLKLRNASAVPGNVLWLFNRSSSAVAWNQLAYINFTVAANSSNTSMAYIGNATNAWTVWKVQQTDNQQMEYLIANTATPPSGVADTTAPTVTINDPKNSTGNYSTSPTVSTTCSDDVGVDSASYDLLEAGVNRVANVSITCGTNFTAVPNATAQYQLIVYAKDAAANVGGAVRFFNHNSGSLPVQKVPGGVQNATWFNGSNYTQSSLNIDAWMMAANNFSLLQLGTIVDIKSERAIVSGAGAACTTANTSTIALAERTNATAIQSINLMSFSGGGSANCSWRIWSLSPFGNWTRSADTFWLFRDGDAGSMTIDRPSSNTSNYSAAPLLDITPTDSESGVDNCWYTHNDGAQTAIPACGDGTSISGSSAGQNVLRVFGIDKAGVVFGNARAYNFQTAAPVLVFHNGQAVSNYTQATSVTVSFSSDRNFSQSPANQLILNQNGSLPLTGGTNATCSTFTNTTICNATFTLGEGNNSAIGWMNDSFGLMDTTPDLRWYVQDARIPFFNLTHPQQGSTYNGAPELKDFVTDNGPAGISECWYSLNAAANTTYTCSANTTTLAGPDGTNTLQACSNDKAGNVNCTTITYTLSSFNLVFTSNQTNFTDNPHVGDWANFSSNITSYIRLAPPNFSRIEWNVSGAMVNTSINASDGNNTWHNITLQLPPVAEGRTIGWRHWANDTNNSFNVTGLSTFIVANSTPNVSSILQSPACVQVGNRITYAYDQVDDGNITNSTADFIMENGTRFLELADSLGPSVSASHVADATGLWTVFINVTDFAGNMRALANNLVEVKVAGGCPSQATPSGGGGGGGTSFVFVNVTQNFTVVKSPEQLAKEFEQSPSATLDRFLLTPLVPSQPLTRPFTIGIIVGSVVALQPVWKKKKKKGGDWFVLAVSGIFVVLIILSSFFASSLSTLFDSFPQAVRLLTGA